MSEEKNKNRLFITLQHRLERPGFHWALLLTPKSESADRDDRDSHLFHATNGISPGMRIAPGGKPGWRYESKPANVLKSRTITARILVAKLSGSESVETQAKRIDRLINRIPLVQDNDEWTCRVWAAQALAVLKAAGGEFSTIPAWSETVESEIVDFAAKAKETILRGKVISHPKDLAQLDLRSR